MVEDYKKDYFKTLLGSLSLLKQSIKKLQELTYLN